MAGTRALSTLIMSLAVLLTFVMTAMAAANMDQNGRISCYTIPDDPNICQLRLSMYYNDWPQGNDGNYYPAVLEIYDHWCNYLGNAYGDMQTAVNVFSELPYSLVVNLPISYARVEDVSGWYAGHALWGTTNTIECIDPDCQPWGSYTSSLYGFPC